MTSWRSKKKKNLWRHEAQVLYSVRASPRGLLSPCSKCRIYCILGSGHGCFGTLNSKYSLKGCRQPDQTRARYQVRVAISEQSCLFLEIPLFIIIFLPDKWHVGGSCFQRPRLQNHLLRALILSSTTVWSMLLLFPVYLLRTWFT
jgi:hypothetical protein